MNDRIISYHEEPQIGNQMPRGSHIPLRPLQVLPPRKPNSIWQKTITIESCPMAQKKPPPPVSNSKNTKLYLIV